MSDSSLLSSEASLSSSDSFDSFSNFDKLKPHDFEPTVSDNENTDKEVSSSAMQTKGAEKERKVGVFVENTSPCLPMLRVCAKSLRVLRKMKSQMKFLTATFFISDYLISISCIKGTCLKLKFIKVQR